MLKMEMVWVSAQLDPVAVKVYVPAGDIWSTKFVEGARKLPSGEFEVISTGVVVSEKVSEPGTLQVMFELTITLNPQLANEMETTSFAKQKSNNGKSFIISVFLSPVALYRSTNVFLFFENVEG